MTDDERLTYLKMIQEDIYVCSLDATFLQISKECALTATIKELEKKISDNEQKVEVIPLSVIDEIKAEIRDEAEFAYADFDRYKEEVLYVEPDELPDDDFRYGLERAFEIINRKVKEHKND